jgi:hypothetical protein
MIIVTDKLETEGLSQIFRAISNSRGGIAPPLFHTRCEMAVTKACISAVTGCRDEMRLNEMYQAGVRPVIDLVKGQISLVSGDGAHIASKGGSV